MKYKNFIAENFTYMSLYSLINSYFSVSLERPNPPVVGKVTHFTIYLEWSHVKEYLPKNKRYRFKIQESSMSGKYEWTTVYT